MGDILKPFAAVPPLPGASPATETIVNAPVGDSNVAGVAAAIADLAGNSGAEVPQKPKNKGGRPPIHGLYSKKNGSDGHTAARPCAVAAVEKPADGIPRAPLPPGLVGKVAKAVADMAEQWGINKVKGAAIKGGVPEDVAAPMVANAKLGETNKELIGELAPHAMAEWGADPAISPTAVIGGILGVWFMGIQSMCSALVAEKKKETPQPAARTETAKPEVEKRVTRVSGMAYPEGLA